MHMKDFIEYLVKAIVTKPEDVLVQQESVEGTYIYTIKVNDEDMGLVIGKQGKTIRSIRDLTKAKAINDNVRIRVELSESQQPKIEE